MTEDELARLTRLNKARLVYTARAANLVPADQPFVLIGQPPRMGGTLMTTLVDGHPQLHVHPYELEIGHPTRDSWPTLDLDAAPAVWFKQLAERHAKRALTHGYQKDRPARRLGLAGQIENPPFLLDFEFMRQLFERLAHERPIASLRDILECYLTSYFNAWLDNQNLYGPQKRWVCGFRGRFGTAENVGSFFETYPDGRYLSCVRDARSWIASARRFSSQAVDLDDFIEAWLEDARWRIRLVEQRPEAAALVVFEEVVGNPGRIMPAVAQWLELDWDPILLVPTFNRHRVRANSSFVVEGPGLVRSALDNWRKELSPLEAAQIEKLTADTYALAIEVATRT